MSCERENLNENLEKLIQYSKVVILNLFKLQLFEHLRYNQKFDLNIIKWEVTSHLTSSVFCDWND